MTTGEQLWVLTKAGPHEVELHSEPCGGVGHVEWLLHEAPSGGRFRIVVHDRDTQSGDCARRLSLPSIGGYRKDWELGGNPRLSD
jgi:hypothetical protein